MQRAALGQALDGDDLGTLGLDREHGAGLHRLAVDVDGAGAAMAGLAADMGATAAPSSSRRKWISSVRGSTSASMSRPLTVSLTICLAMAALLSALGAGERPADGAVGHHAGEVAPVVDRAPHVGDGSAGGLGGGAAGGDRGIVDGGADECRSQSTQDRRLAEIGQRRSTAWVQRPPSSARITAAAAVA